MKHILTIPKWRPTTANELLSLHHMVAHRRKKADANMVWAMMREQRIPTALKRRKIDITIKQKPGRGRLIDPDACLKSLLDALKQARLIIDDSQRWCECLMPKIERGTKDTWGTLIILEDCND